MTEVEIVNQSLMLAGMPKITNFSDESAEAELVKALYPKCRDRLLRDYPWSFALAHFTLSALDEKSAEPDFPAVSLLPGDSLRVIRLQSRRPYLIRGRKIYTKDNNETILYITRIDNSALFDESFVDALIYLIAHEASIHSGRDYNFTSYLAREYLDRIAAARNVNAMENIHDLQIKGRDSEFVKARRS